MVEDSDEWYGSWRPLGDLLPTFEIVHDVTVTVPGSATASHQSRTCPIDGFDPNSLHHIPNHVHDHMPYHVLGHVIAAPKTASAHDTAQRGGRRAHPPNATPPRPRSDRGCGRRRLACKKEETEAAKAEGKEGGRGGRRRRRERRERRDEGKERGKMRRRRRRRPSRALERPRPPPAASIPK